MFNTLFAEELKWVVYYSDKEPVSTFEPYDLLILDSDHHPSLKALKERGKTLLGYISLGEVEDNRRWFSDVKKEGILLGENKSWKGSYYVDVRDKRWIARVVEELVPEILQKGFNGLFLDTLDNPEFLESKDPKKYAGMKEAAEKIVKALRIHYPDIPIMLNRGYYLMPKVGHAVTYLMAEDVLSLWNDETQKYELIDSSEVSETVKMLQGYKKQFPDLEIVSLDYWYPKETKKIAEFYKKEREFGFSPYVATWDLDKVIPEPK